MDTFSTDELRLMARYFSDIANQLERAACLKKYDPSMYIANINDALDTDQRVRGSMRDLAKVAGR